MSIFRTKRISTIYAGFVYNIHREPEAETKKKRRRSFDEFDGHGSFNDFLLDEVLEEDGDSAEKKAPEAVLPELTNLVTKEDDDVIDSWEFNILDHDALEQHRFVWVMFERMDLFNKYDIDLERFPEYLMECKRLYNVHNNQYHNYEHGIDGIDHLIMKDCSSI